jgi:hypothetical protein
MRPKQGDYTRQQGAKAAVRATFSCKLRGSRGEWIFARKLGHVFCLPLPAVAQAA